MKKLLSLCALLFPFSLLAQTFENTGRWGAEIYHFEMLTDSSYFLAGNDGLVEADYTVHYLDGTTLPLFSSPGRVANFDFVVDPTGGYFYSYLDISCDVFGSRIHKLDESGFELWNTDYDLFGEEVKLAVFSNGDLLFTQDSKLFKVDGQGDFLWDLELGQPIYDIAIDTADFIYVSLETGVFKLDKNGIDLDIMTFELISDLTANEDGVLAGYNSKDIYFYNGNLELIAEQDFGFFEIIFDVDYGENEVAVLLGNDTSTVAVEVKIYDYDLIEIDQFDLPGDISWEDIEIENGKIYLAGREFYGMEKYASVVKDFSFGGGTENYGEDVALSNLSVDSVGWMPFSGFEILIFHGPEVRMENKGTDTLESVWISVLGGYSMNPWCNWRRIFSEEFNGLSLAPGESIGLNLSDLEYNIIPKVNDLELCYYAHLPNRHIDNHHSDNFTCSDFIVSTNEVNHKKLKIEISPNPASEYLNINLSEPIKSIVEIYIVNNNGQIVKSVFINSFENDCKIELNDLVSGSYFLRMRIDDEVVSERFYKK